MKSPSTANRIVLVVVSVMLLLLSGTLAWALAVDYHTRGVVTEGVSLAGVDLSGMTESEARSAIEQAVSAPTLRPLTVTGNSGGWKLDPSDYVHVDVEAMLDEAYAPRRNATLIKRLASEVTGDPIPAEVEPRVSVDTSAVAQWVAATAEQIDRKPRNAKREVDGYKLEIAPSAKGVRVSQKKATAKIVAALSADSAISSDGQRVVKLPTKTLKPKVDESDFDQGIVVSLNKCRVYYYEGEKLVRSYRCAPGQARFPTPTGDFKVVRKLANAPWINPGSDWAKSMPRSIPAGPSNPMGVRKIGINVPGIFFHGIPASEYSSIGTHASHGCMRMMPSDVLDLYGRVKVGTEVFIRD